jgi:hypothetical protein
MISKKTLKLKLSNQIKNNYLSNDNRFNMISEKQFFDYFLPQSFNYIIVEENEKSDIYIYDIFIKNKDIMKDDEINMLISIENLPFWNIQSHAYNHFENFGEFGNDKINIYLYNHLSTMSITENYLAIPLVYNFINYYKNNEHNINPNNEILFKDKKFALAINKSKLNSEITNIINKLKNIGEVDDISLYNNIIENKSLYHSQELISVFNNYKFIICYENSYANGYVTEKIFNCFFSKSIPLYKGAPNVLDYFNKESFVDLHNNDIDEQINLIISLNNNEDLYNNMINYKKISDNYDDKNYEKELTNFIENKLNK